MSAGDGRYISIAEVRAEGFLEADFSDDRVASVIAVAEAAFERATENWFYRKQLTLRLDGSDQELLRLPHPICQGDNQITSVVVTSGGVDVWTLSATDFETYNDADDRWFPRLAMLGDLVGGRWPAGRRNVVVTGYFGFTDYELVTPEPGEGEGEDPEPVPTWTCPPEVKLALLRMVARDLPPVGDAGAQLERDQWRVTGETTRSRSVSMAEAMNLGGPTGDPDIDRALVMFRRPSIGGVV